MATPRSAGGRLHARVGAAAFLLIAALIGASVLLVAGPAGADVNTVTGSAFGISGLSGPPSAPLPGGVSGTASDPAAGFGPLVASVHLIELPGVLTVDGVGASTSGVITPGTHNRLATAAASVEGLSVAGGLVTAARLSSTCTSSADGSSGSALLEGVAIGGIAVAASPPANTVVAIPNVLRAVLNEQTVDDAPGSTGIAVRAIDLQVLPDNHGRAALEVILAESRCGTMGATGAPATPPGRRARVLPLIESFPPPPAVGPALPVPGAVTPPAPAAPPGASGPAPSAAQPFQPLQEAPGSPAEAGAPAVTPRSGPPGAQIRVVASGYGSCGEVGVSFNGIRIGSARPDAAGRVDQAGLSIPGDTSPGRHSVGTSCLSSARSGTRSADFEVTHASVHRSAFATSVAEPGQVSTRLRTVLSSVLVTAGLVLLIVFPADLFNATLDENYDEVRSWFGLGPRSSGGMRPLHQALALSGFIIFGGVLYGFLSPDFGLNRSSLALGLGLSVSLALISVVFRLPFLLHSRQHHGEWARLKVLPGTALVAVACVGLSRLLNFQPGYLYGLIAGLEFQREPEDTTGRLTSLAALTILIIGLVTWAARAPVAAAAARAGAGFWVVAADACLAAIFVTGLTTLVFSLIPLRFLEGSKVTRWSRAAWVGLFASGLFAFVHILLQPTSGYVGHTQAGQKWVVIALFVGFGLFSIGFWAYFRFRPARTSPEHVAVG
ncbi:MAG TPA: choice-of-anchor P family protein [Actinomycetota bacterium]|nr:choice-of-anchor P family protein [Actinomycetota bacterium]